jgi:hypothetical protein
MLLVKVLLLRRAAQVFVYWLEPCFALKLETLMVRE